MVPIAICLLSYCEVIAIFTCMKSRLFIAGTDHHWFSLPLSTGHCLHVFPRKLDDLVLEADAMRKETLMERFLQKCLSPHIQERSSGIPSKWHVTSSWDSWGIPILILRCGHLVPSSCNTSAFGTPDGCQVGAAVGVGRFRKPCVASRDPLLT